MAIRNKDKYFSCQINLCHKQLHTLTPAPKCVKHGGSGGVCSIFGGGIVILGVFYLFSCLVEII